MVDWLTKVIQSHSHRMFFGRRCRNSGFTGLLLHWRHYVYAQGVHGSLHKGVFYCQGLLARVLSRVYLAGERDDVLTRGLVNQLIIPNP